jgi:hypothetical protein
VLREVVFDRFSNNRRPRPLLLSCQSIETPDLTVVEVYG